MKIEYPLNKEAFIKRVTALILRSGLSGLPRDDLDQHVLLKSAALAFKQGESFRESEVTARLKLWAAEIGDIPGMDAITIRRVLVDAGYLSRAADGSSYRISPDGPRLKFFDATVVDVDLAEELEKARSEMERKKKEYLERAGR